MVVFDDRTEMEVLDRASCRELLRTEVIGRIAFSDDEETSIFPVNYVFHQERVVFRTAGGAKLTAAIGNTEVAFEVDGIEDGDHTGWSVVVHGVLKTVTAADEVEDLQKLDLRPWARAPKEHWLVIDPRRISGRRILTRADQNRVGPYQRVSTRAGSPKGPQSPSPDRRPPGGRD